MKKIFFLILFSIFLISTFTTVKGQTVSAEEMVNLDEEVTASDLGIEEPSILPGHPFYFLKDWSRNIRSFFMFNPVKKLTLQSKFANEKLIELKKMIESDVNQDNIQKATEEYRERIEKTEEISKKIKKTEENEKEIKSFSDKFTKDQILHQKILQKLEEQVPEKTYQKIKEVKENHLDKFQKVLSKMEGKEKIPETVDNALENMKGSQFKEIEDIEILKNIKEKAPEEIRNQIEERVEKRIKTLEQKLENASSEDQEKLQEYIQENHGDAKVHLDILDSLKGRGLSEKAQKAINRIRQIPLRKIKEKSKNQINSEQVQKQITENASLLETVKTLILKNDLGKQTAPEIFDLIQNAEIDLDKAQEYIQQGNFSEAFGEIQSSKSLSDNTKEILKEVGGFKIDSTKEIGEIKCSDKKVPVCGKDEVTYKNLCQAQKVNAIIAYRGKCQENLECAQKGERVNRNPLQGPVSQECCQGLEEYRITTSYSICEDPDKEFQCETAEDCPLPKTSGVQSKCVDGKCVIPKAEEEQICIQVITPAIGPEGECKEFPTPCDVPQGWTEVSSCEDSKIQLKDTEKQKKIEEQNQMRKEQFLKMQEQIKESIEKVLENQDLQNISF